MTTLQQIKNGEGKRIEFKQELPTGNKLSKTVIAFSNCAGGKIIIGVADNGELVGVSNDEVIELPDKISNIIFDTCYPAIVPEIYCENIDGKNMLIIEIFTGNLKPYYIKSEGKNNGTYIRVGATNKPADQEMISELERQKRNISFDEECLYDYNLSMLDFSKLKNDFRRFANKELTNIELVNLKLIKQENGIEYCTKAVLLLTDSNYHEFARIKCARFKGNDIVEFVDQKEFGGPEYQQIENTMNFAKMYIAKKGIITELQRYDEYEVPLVAIKEALTNAVVHRDYSISGADIKFAIFDDRIEITSPGQLPKTLDIDDIRVGRSEIRNKIIARFFKEIRFIEGWGTGIRRIMFTCKEIGLKEPDFIETGMYFKVIIYKKKDEASISSDKVAISSDKVAISSDKVAIISDENKLTESEKKILEYLNNNETVNNKLAREVTEFSSAGVRKLFDSLIKKKLIVPMGANKNRCYMLRVE